MNKVENKPLVGREIYFIPIKTEGNKKSTIISWKDSKISNPSSITDSNGNFNIKVPNNYDGRSGEFSIGLDPSNFNPPLLVFSGAINSFKADIATKEITLGKTLVEQ